MPVAVQRLDKEIKQRYNIQNNRKIFDSLPGAAPQLAPGIMVAFGSDRSRYQSANDLQKYAGIAPVIDQSGQKKWAHCRDSCPKFLGQTFVEWAGQSVRYSFRARAYSVAETGFTIVMVCGRQLNFTCCPPQGVLSYVFHNIVLLSLYK